MHLLARIESFWDRSHFATVMCIQEQAALKSLKTAAAGKGGFAKGKKIACAKADAWQILSTLHHSLKVITASLTITFFCLAQQQM